MRIVKFLQLPEEKTFHLICKNMDVAMQKKNKFSKMNVKLPLLPSDKNKQTSPTLNTPRRLRRPSSTLTTDKVLNKNVKASIKLKQPQQSSVKLATNAYGSGKCKRRLWIEIEEEALKAGVQKFSKKPIKNIPWRKILGLGQHVFDRTHTPSDLKDKWRNMCNGVEH
ncbi:hypothetical protein DH2020_020329 [Rehmannia glutinosa]|uniref:Myb-like domain-containing protein n=1 Tax=Rehmannia glutinosa TaxID=99300 RepID=A0ABR0WKJ8_REHGL